MVNIAILFAQPKENIILKKISLNHRIWIVNDDPMQWRKQDEFIVCSLDETIRKYIEGTLDFFLLFPLKYKCIDEVFLFLVNNGVNSCDIYKMSIKQLAGVETLDVMHRYSENNELEYLAIHVCDYCNLRCNNCAAMCDSNYVKKNISLSKTVESLNKLKKYYDNVINIQLVGGEPLLNNELLLFCENVRRIFPYSLIEIVTNGTMILNQTVSFFETLSNLKIIVSISYYPVLSDRIDEINDILKKLKVEYKISEKIRYFENLYDLNGDSDIEKTYRACKSIPYCKNGLNLLENYLYPCLAPIALYRYGIINKENYSLDLDQCSNIKKAIDSVVNIKELCRFCHIDYHSKWRQLSDDEINIKSNWSV